MSDQDLFLSHYFTKSPGGARFSAQPGGSDFQTRVNREIKKLKWPVRIPGVAPQASEVLDIRIPDLLVVGWNKARELAVAFEESRMSPREIIDVSLAEHTFEATLHPFLEIRINGIAQPTKIRFTVELTCTLKGVVLQILNGHITNVIEGTCEFKGALKYEELTIVETPDELQGPIELRSTFEPGAGEI